MASTWQEFKEEAADCLRGIRLEATTNHAVQGVRTKHAIDVNVKSHHVGWVPIVNHQA